MQIITANSEAEIRHSLKLPPFPRRLPISAVLSIDRWRAEGSFLPVGEARRGVRVNAVWTPSRLADADGKFFVPLAARRATKKRSWMNQLLRIEDILKLILFSSRRQKDYGEGDGGLGGGRGSAAGGRL